MPMQNKWKNKHGKSKSISLNLFVCMCVVLISFIFDRNYCFILYSRIIRQAPDRRCAEKPKHRIENTFEKFLEKYHCTSEIWLKKAISLKFCSEKREIHSSKIQLVSLCKFLEQKNPDNRGSTAFHNFENENRIVSFIYLHGVAVKKMKTWRASKINYMRKRN